MSQNDKQHLGQQGNFEQSRYQTMIDGIGVDPAPNDVTVIPRIVTPLQIRKALRQMGLKQSIDGFIATLSEEAQEEWEYAIGIDRNSPLIAQAASLLNKTEEDIDNLFKLAASL